MRTFLLLVMIAGCAGTKCPPARPATPQRAFLWEATAPGGATVSLFGTWHLAVARDVPQVAWNRLERAPVFALELEPAPLSLDLRPMRELPRGQSLTDLISAEAFFDLRDALAGKVDEATLRRLRPFYATSLLIGNAWPRHEAGMDEALRRRAEAAGKKVEGLEEWKEQLGALDAALGVPELLQAIRDRDRLRCLIRDELDGYRAGDEVMMSRHLGTEQADVLIDQRTAAWLARIEGYGKARGAFVAVGVFHLLGSRGLPALLAARGWQVRRVE